MIEILMFIIGAWVAFMLGGTMIMFTVMMWWVMQDIFGGK